jgi:tRNA U55 pseudouridine synthase TruB
LASEAIALDRLEGIAQGGVLEQYLYPIDVAFYDLPALHVDDQGAYRLATGQHIQSRDLQVEEGTCARAYGPGEQFIALVCCDQDGDAWRPRKVFVAPEALTPSRSADVT